MPGESIIFIDEVQEAVDVVTRIKFWVEDGRFKYVLSGSLLGIELGSLRSAPVGYISEIRMYPIDFEEFLKASKVTDDTLDYLKKCFIRKIYLKGIEAYIRLRIVAYKKEICY